MKNIRIGNDILVKLTSLDQESLEGRDITVLITTFGYKKKIEYSVSGNILTFSFLGMDQRILGTYTILVIENMGKPGMRTVDICKAFRLVACSCDAGGSDPDQLETITLSFDFELLLSGMILYSDIKNKPKINGVEVNGDKSLGDFGIMESEQVLSKDIATIIEELNEPEEPEESIQANK